MNTTYSFEGISQNQPEANGLGQLNPTDLAAALRAASEAHHEYEAGLGHADEDWAGWYAGHASENLATQGVTVESATLASLIGTAADVYPVYEEAAKASGETPVEWPDFYSEYTVNEARLADQQVAYANE